MGYQKHLKRTIELNTFCVHVPSQNLVSLLRKNLLFLVAEINKYKLWNKFDFFLVRARKYIEYYNENKLFSYSYPKYFIFPKIFLTWTIDVRNVTFLARYSLNGGSKFKW